MFTCTQEALDWLYSTQLFGMKLGLDHTKRLLKACGLGSLLEHHPQNPQIIHVAGTNGKGSTCAMMESIARAAGYRTAMFTSPHLVQFHERARVNKEMIDDESLLRLINKLHQITEDWVPCPTFFELTTALALMYFYEQKCDLMILETGMGGRLDSTNCVAKDLAVLLPIGLDHTQFLGDSLASIAAEKAGIITSALPVISAAQEPAALAVIQERCAATGSPLKLIMRTYEGDCGLKGQHQSMNAALAAAAMRALPQFRGGEEAIAQGLSQVQWAGRFERISSSATLGTPEKQLILDGAHNAHAMRCLVQTWQAEFGKKSRPSCIFAAAADKDIHAVLELLAPMVGRWILPQAQSPRLATPEQMAAVIRDYSTVPISCCDSLSESLTQADAAAPTLLCGSLFLVGEMKALLAEASASYRKTMQ